MQHEQQPGGIDATNAPWCNLPRMSGFGRSWIGMDRTAFLFGEHGGVDVRRGHHVQAYVPLDFSHDRTAERCAMSEAMEREGSGKGKFPAKVYERELFRLQEELVKMEQWAYDTGARIVAIFEGRDAAGKGGAIKRITEHTNPRITRHIALPKPSDRERSEWYFQRYIEEIAGGRRDRAVRS